MKRLILAVLVLAITATISIPLFGFRVAVPTNGNYGQKGTKVYVQSTPTGTPQTDALVRLQQACNCGPVSATWYAKGIYGWNPVKGDPSLEPVTILGGIFSDAITNQTYKGINYVTLQNRVYPNYKTHSDRDKNYLMFYVPVNTCTPTSTLTPTSTYTANLTYTPTATLN